MKLAIFDFDGTLFLEQTIPFFINEWENQGYPKGRLIMIKSKIIGLYLQHKLKLISRDVFRTKVIRFFPTIFTGMNKQEIIDYFSQAANNADQHFNQDIIRELRQAQADSFHTVLLSGCYTLFLDIIGEKLNIDTVLGTELYFNQQLKIDYLNINHINGSQKSSIIRDHFASYDINWEESRAYADSINDLGLLNMVGIPIAVKPDQELKRQALAQNWLVLE